MINARRATDATDTSAFDVLEPRLKLLVDELAWWTTTPAAGRRREQR